MRRALLPLLVTCGLLGMQPQRGQGQEPQTPDWRMTLKTIRNGVHKIDTYLNAALDLLGGEDGLCQYKCSDGYKPFPRYDYKPSPPNGCGSPLFGVQFDIGIPSMTKCCNQHDRCYDTCGNKKNDCDEQFQYCLSKICRDVQKTLGIPESVQEYHHQLEYPFQSFPWSLSKREWLVYVRGEFWVVLCMTSLFVAAIVGGKWGLCFSCESTVQLLFDAVIHLGCKPYLDSQRAACMCQYEDKRDL